jgi:hypothetical protein
MNYNCQRPPSPQQPPPATSWAGFRPLLPPPIDPLASNPADLRPLIAWLLSRRVA